jgi:hypothetical protein
VIAMNTKRERVALNATQEDLDRLERLRVLAGTATNAETVRRAIKAYEWALRKLAEGHHFVVEDKDGHRTEVVLLL